MNVRHHTDPVFNPGRPWPVSPAEYPLSGPSRGRVYLPPVATNPAGRRMTDPRKPWLRRLLRWLSK